VNHCQELLETHPEETPVILKYLADVGAFAAVEGALVRFLKSEDAVYSYQVYLVVEWLCEEADEPSSEVVAVIRAYAFDNSAPAYLRAVSRAFLGSFGEIADLERLQTLYVEAGNSLEQSEIMCSLVRMERGRRNAFIARASGDGDWNRRAAEWIKRHG